MVTASQAIISVTQARPNIAQHLDKPAFKLSTKCNFDDYLNLPDRQPRYKDNSFSIDLSSRGVTPVSTQAVKEYLSLMWPLYQVGSREYKAKILDAIVLTLKIHRKSAIRLMNSSLPPRSNQGKKSSGRKKPYSEEAKKHLVILWRQMGNMGSLRMQAALPDWIDSYHARDFNDHIKDELLRMSARTIERFLVQAKANLRRRQNTSTRRGVKRLETAIPVRNLAMKPVEPGHCEVDLVAHCGNNISGGFVYTLTLTDIITGWTECRAIWTKKGAGVRLALRDIEEKLPFKIKSFYFDNGGEFLNCDIVKYATKNRDTPILIFRSRPYKKNDQCYIEQKNHTHVRNIFGYARIDDISLVKPMNEIYREEWSNIQNLYCPQQKLLSKVRIASKTIRKMDKPSTPLTKLTPFLSSRVKQNLLKKKASCDPIASMATLREAVRNIYGLINKSFSTNEWGKTIL